MDEPPRDHPNDPLHGVTLERMVCFLQEKYGWKEMGEEIRIRCFQENPSVNSSLKFLRKTAWAREKVEEWYRYEMRRRD